MLSEKWVTTQLIIQWLRECFQGGEKMGPSAPEAKKFRCNYLIKLKKNTGTELETKVIQIIITKSKKIAWQNEITYCDTKLWNQISDEIKMTSFYKFEKLYKQKLFEQLLKYKTIWKNTNYRYLVFLVLFIY